jgi:hypothetical protein
MLQERAGSQLALASWVTLRSGMVVKRIETTPSPDRHDEELLEAGTECATWTS